MAMADMGWMDICIGGGASPPQVNFGSSHLQAVVSELDVVIRDVEGALQTLAPKP